MEIINAIGFTLSQEGLWIVPFKFLKMTFDDYADEVIEFATYEKMIDYLIENPEKIPKEKKG